MKTFFKKDISLVLAGIVLSLGLAFYGWLQLFPTDAPGNSGNNLSADKPLAGRSSSDDSIGENRGAPGLNKKADFRERAEALKSRIHADEKKAATHTQAVRQLLAEWAQSDPEAALSYALSSDAEDAVEGLFFAAADAALTTWARQDPERARLYVEQQSESPQWAAELGPAMMRVYASTGSAKAREWVSNGFADDSGELRPVIARELALVLCEQGRNGELTQWLADPQVAECAYGQKAVAASAAELARGNIQEALSFSKELPRGSMSRGLALQETLRAWTAKDSTQAYTWISVRLQKELSTAEPRPGSGKEKTLPAEGYTPDELDYAISGYVMALAGTSTKEALESAKGIRNPSLRQRIEQEVAKGS